MAGSVLDALLKAGVVSKEETPQAKREAEQKAKQREEQAERDRASEEASEGPSRGPTFEAPAKTVAKTSDPAAGLKPKTDRKTIPSPTRKLKI
jgi:hypothetical protein